MRDLNEIFMELYSIKFSKLVKKSWSLFFKKKNYKYFMQQKIAVTYRRTCD